MFFCGHENSLSWAAALTASRDAKWGKTVLQQHLTWFSKLTEKLIC